MNGIKESHPSYGQMELSRTTSNKGIPLYGTSSKFHETIRLTICHSEYRRNLHRAWHYAQKPIIEVEMSPAQFAEAITSLNNGGGTPVTIRRTEKDWNIPEPPFKDERDLFHKEFEEDVQEIFSKADTAIEKATAMLEQKTVTKTALKEIINQLASIKQDLQSNMPFLARSFNEHIDKTVSSGKVELETFIGHKIHSMGLEALKSGLPEARLLESKE